jgi:arabinose-5-phosphate isomerase
MGALMKMSSGNKQYHKMIESYIEGLNSLTFDKHFDNAISLICNCKGKIITSGMGKAGLAMKKFSSSLSSLGIPSVFIHPGEASHGDLGLIQKKDILFVASTSGKTREIIELIHLYKRLYKNKVIGITSHPDSVIREEADIVIDMGDFEEIGVLKLAPTVSIVLMLALTDIIAVSSSEMKKFSSQDFSKYHHSGYLGDLSKGMKGLL